VKLWDGSIDAPEGDATPPFTLVLRDAGSLRRMLLPPSELRITEAYMRGDYDIEGNIEAATAFSEHVRKRLSSPRAVARLSRTLLELPSGDDGPTISSRIADWWRAASPRHSPERDAVAVRSHYDVGNDFYQLWLDERMVYSCAYFENPAASIDEAQTAKLEHLCRKLRLRPGESLLDVGCGWGGLVIYAARRFGVNAVGVTLSHEQAALARARIRAAGLEATCTIEVRDYRHLPMDEGFDKIVSVGMVEHVGCDMLPTYFAHMYGLLRPGGLFMNHGIVHRPDPPPTLVGRVGAKLWHEGDFIDRYVFPDGELPALEDIIRTAEHAGFETRDVESLREHYALTLRHWIARLERAHDRAIALVGEQTYRTWRLYMAASAYGFASGRLRLAQTLLAKPTAGGSVEIPLTRADIYAH
jgi:cyclopropane-fatty-acyl-phospholipid synthase